jgi:hypothetical protein
VFGANRKGKVNLYIAGRPYKFNHSDLSINIQSILVDGMGEIVGVVNKTIQSTPTEFEITQNYPNPFNPTTIINYTLPTESKVKVEIFSQS